MSEIVTREEFDKYIELQKKICDKVAEVASHFSKFQNTKGAMIKQEFSGLEFPIQAPPDFRNARDHYIGFRRHGWMMEDSFEIVTRDEDGDCGVSVEYYALPVSYLGMTSEEIYDEAVRIKQNIEDKKNADKKKTMDAMLKNQYQTYLKLRAKFENMPKERIAEINGGDSE